MTSMAVVKLATLAVLLVGSWSAEAKGAGRAFPIESENFAIENFKTVNPSLEWDETNFLVDLSGHYANCKAVHSPPGVVSVSRLTRSGQTVVGIVDFTDGRGSDSTAVNGYIRTIIGRWQNTQLYYNQIKAASVFGCSVRPACGNHAVIACLFSPGYDANQPTDRPTPRPTLRPTLRPTPSPSTPRPAPRTTTTTEAAPHNPTERPDDIRITPKGDIRALAFTPQQYDESEGVLGRKWDRSHYLENLSGYETDCSMIGKTDWPFTFMKQQEQPGSRFIGQYGSAQNRGSTPDALKEVISKFKPITNSREIGCSLIPDCIHTDRQMYVVVSCLFEETATE